MPLLHTAPWFNLGLCLAAICLKRPIQEFSPVSCLFWPSERNNLFASSNKENITERLNSLEQTLQNYYSEPRPAQFKESSSLQIEVDWTFEGIRDIALMWNIVLKIIRSSTFRCIILGVYFLGGRLESISSNAIILIKCILEIQGKYW